MSHRPLAEPFNVMSQHSPRPLVFIDPQTFTREKEYLPRTFLTRLQRPDARQIQTKKLTQRQNFESFMKFVFCGFFDIIHSPRTENTYIVNHLKRPNNQPSKCQMRSFVGKNVNFLNTALKLLCKTN